MTVITLPDNNFRDAQWTLDVPQQVNRSAWTGRRTTMRLPGASRWHVSASHVPIIGEVAFRPWKSLLARLRGSENPFLMLATESPQVSSIGIAFTGTERAASNFQNTTATVRTVAKTGGTNGAWDGLFRSNAATTGDIRLMVRIGSGRFILGLTTGGGIADPPVQPFSLYYLGGSVIVRESNVNLSSFVANAGDIVVVERKGTVIRYYRNGELLRSTTVAGGTSLWANLQFAETGAMVTDFFVSDSSTAVTNAISIGGLAINTAQAVRDGWMATALLEGGGAQLLTVTVDAASNGTGSATVNVEPELRGIPMGIVLDRPFAQLGLDGAATGWRVDPGQIYSIAITATEAF